MHISKISSKHGYEKIKTTIRYTLYGAMFGILFPVFSTIVDCLDRFGAVNMHNAAVAQRSGHLHWVIDTAPFFLGLFAFFAGTRQTKIEGINEELMHDIDVKSSEIKYLSEHDPATGLLKHSHFISHLKQSLEVCKRYGRSFAVYSINFVEFKDLIHTFGHEESEVFLMKIASNIRSSLRKSDLVSRFGVSEFYVLVLDIEDYNNIVLVAENIINAARRFRISPDFGSLKCHIGVSFFPTDGDDIDRLLQYANASRSLCKNSHESSYRIFNQSFEKNILRKQELNNALKKAIAENELEVYYQPKHDRNLIIVGAEALLRWKSPLLGPVRPDEFIPVAEENGMITELGYWVLEEVCRKTGSIAGENFRVAVNLSHLQLLDQNFYKKFNRILEKTGFDPRFLEIEITESSLPGDREESADILSRFSEKGISISIDDFGTGYSTMARLLELPIDSIKIDKSFVSNINSDARNYALVKSMVNLAGALGMQVIAEGVETEQQFSILKQMDCTLFQGFLYHPPQPVESIYRLLKVADSLVSGVKG